MPWMDQMFSETAATCKHCPPCYSQAQAGLHLIAEANSQMTFGQRAWSQPVQASTVQGKTQCTELTHQQESW